ncbi:Translocon-associated protein beta [Teladorsagia circumcincta]|uniref:Translocon-associated protein beta n=1 Tax=Teladorsagia circumcincta TaxID=45464 RepID=A0A2G9TXH5_TELCI|nr:Translocon-associated protein beta [Teladorsagia circumcincta]
MDLVLEYGLYNIGDKAALKVRPRQFGVFNYTSAQVTYISEGSTDIRVGYTNAPGEGYIYRLKEYERKFAPKYIYWIVFFILIAPTTLGSLLAYSKSKTKYVELAKKKN